jgi:FKBP-type peptidyl-prolyl cis-trans isomerase SlyD
MMQITKNSVVSLRYIMKNIEGDILENTMNDLPISYLHGSGVILGLLQAQLDGLKAGDKKRVYLKAASGSTTEDFIFEVIVDEVRVALKEELLLGYPVKITIQKCEADCDCYSGTVTG